MNRPWKTDYNLKNIDEAISKLKGYIGELEAAVAERNGVVLRVDLIPRPPGGYERQEYETWFKQCRETHEKNLPAIENNKRVMAEASQYLRSLGLPDTESVVVPNSRSYPPKTRGVTAGWKMSLEKFVPTDDGWSRAEAEYKQGIARIEELEQKQRAEQEAKRRQLERAAKEKELQKLIWQLEGKYGWKEGCGPETALTELLARNKYLRLAHFLSLNRGDWSEGYSYAEDGLDCFVLETDEDRNIACELRELIQSDDGYDGRVFRDCKYNYNVLFTKAREQDAALAGEYEKLRELISEVDGGTWR